MTDEGTDPKQDPKQDPQQDRQVAAAVDDPLAAGLRGFGPLGLLAMLVILFADIIVKPLSAMLVLVWAWRSRTPRREIGYAQPRSWVGGVAVGIVFGCAFKLLLKAVVMPLFGTDPINHAYHFLVGNRAALPGVVLALIVGAGFGEETLFRGYLFERFGKLLAPRLGTGTGAKTTIVLLTTALFAQGHYAIQGLAGVGQATITGLVFGTIYAVTGRLWMLMWAHAAFDLMAVAIIYGNVEAEVAHLVFS